MASLVVNGSVGIGTTAPAAMLHVVGNLFASGDVDAFYTASDARFKTDLDPIADFDVLLEAITPYRFRWNDDGEREAMKPTGSEDVGLLAQEVDAVLSEATRTSRVGDRDHMSLDYTKLLPVLVAAIKESQREIDELRLELSLRLRRPASPQGRPCEP